MACQFSWNKQYNYTSCENCLKSLETAQNMARRLTSNYDLELPYTDQCCDMLKERKLIYRCPRCHVCNRSSLNSPLPKSEMYFLLNETMLPVIKIQNHKNVVYSVEHYYRYNLIFSRLSFMYHYCIIFIINGGSANEVHLYYSSSQPRYKFLFVKISRCNSNSRRSGSSTQREHTYLSSTFVLFLFRTYFAAKNAFLMLRSDIIRCYVWEMITGILNILSINWTKPGSKWRISF